jgi:outer membrane protein assembly factor BamB
MRSLLVGVWLIGLALTAHAQQTGTPRSVLAADYSKKIIAILAPDGSVEWKQPVGPIHDAHVLPNGNILFQSNWTRLVEMTRQGQVVWEYDAAKSNGNAGRKVEVHAFQPLPGGLLMIAESGPARIIEIDRDGRIVKQIKLTVDNPSAHSDTRHVRKLDNGHYLVAHESDSKVREYDPEGKVVWEYAVPLFGKSPKPGHGPDAFGNCLFSAVRLPNGNTLIGTGNGHSVLEVAPDHRIVWKLEQNDLPGIRLAWVCRVERLPNGNTFLVNCHAGPDNPQLLEVTPDRQVAWSFKDHQTFGDSTAVGLVLP